MRAILKPVIDKTKIKQGEKPIANEKFYIEMMFSPYDVTLQSIK